GCPAHVKNTGSGRNLGILRIDYSGFSGQRSLEKISWKAFFDAFERSQLAFLYQDDTGSSFSKLVSRSSVKVENGNGARRGHNKKASTKRATRSKNGTDAIDLLKRQHREAEELFEKLEAAKSDTQKERIFAKLADELAAHTKIEEEIFYPTAFAEGTEDQLREAVEEHLVAKRLLADLMKMKASDPQFMSKVAVLKEVVLHHVKEEEGELFGKVRKECGDDLAWLGERMQQRYRQLVKGHPSRAVPKETTAAAEL